MSSHAKGLNFECLKSKELHQHGIPVLLSSLVLRELHCGQVDVAVMKNDQIELYELKLHEHLSKTQRYRLQRTANLVAAYLEKSVSLKFVHS